MPVISFASPKGGAGKTTSALVLATELAVNGQSVVVLDADPNQAITAWQGIQGSPEGLEVVGDINEQNILDAIDEASERASFVIIDLEGTANMCVSYAIGRSDLVIIPTQCSQLDIREAGKAIALVKQQEKAFRLSIPFKLLLTRPSPAIRSRTMKYIEEEIQGASIPRFTVEMIERDAFKALHSFGGTLEGLSPKDVGGLQKAIANADAFATEVIETLKEGR